jgi:hypothetical protein
MTHSLVWCWWHFIRWCIVLCNADGASSYGAPSFLMVVTLDQLAQLSVLLVALHRMARSLIWSWWRFIRWRTALCGAEGTFRRRNVLPGAGGGALSYGTPFLLMLVALHQMAHLHFWCWWLFWMAQSCVVVVALHQMAHLSFLVVAVVEVALYQMAQSLVRWWWWRFIRWRAFLSGAGDAGHCYGDVVA